MIEPMTMPAIGPAASICKFYGENISPKTSNTISQAAKLPLSADPAICPISSASPQKICFTCIINFINWRQKLATVPNLRLSVT